MVKQLKQLVEEVVAGDAGGNPQNIAMGTNSGAIVNKGPEVIGKKKKIKESDDHKDSEKNK